MNSFRYSLALLTVFSTAAIAQDQPAESGLKTDQQKASYGVGRNIGESFRRQGIELDLDALIAGLRDASAGKPSQVSEAELEAATMAFQKQIQRKQALERIARDPELKALADKNLADGRVYLAANAKREGVKTTESGLQYRVLKAGDGKVNPSKTSRVKTHYHGTLTNGEVFDSSVQRDEPATFRVDQVIAGWTEALQLMKVGDKWELVIPANLAYDLSPRPGGPIGPNAVLIFEVELLEIVE